jgi:hypothetical protein
VPEQDLVLSYLYRVAFDHNGILDLLVHTILNLGRKGVDQLVAP